MVNDLVNLGHKKTIIGKLLLGTSGYAPILKFTDTEDLNFGVKPLAKIGETTKYNLHLVYAKESDYELIELLNSKNKEFSEELKEKLVNYLNSDELNGRKQYTLTKKRKTQIDDALNDILSEVFELDEESENSDEDQNGTKLE
jgi:hypothetical protein